MDTNLTVRNNPGLPETANELHKFILVGKEQLKAHNAKIRAIDKISESREAKKAALEDGQAIAEVLLQAEAKFGELLAAIEPVYEKPKLGSLGGTQLQATHQPSLPPSVTKKESHKAQTIAKNPAIVERVVQQAVMEGRLPTSEEVYRQIKRMEAVAKQEATAENIIRRPDGLYDVIVIDPPWPIEKIERDCRQNQHALDYPTMPLEDIGNLELKMAENCHVWLWTTHRFLPSSFDLLKIWGLKYVCTFVWNKPSGFQPFGLPQYNCEFALYARRGTPKFVTTKAFPVCFSAQRGKHSEKPEAFYETIRRVTIGRRLDMFNRRYVEGFDGMGNEALSEQL